nr:hevamine-A-like [Ziziphus jujuba var. spinosa]
MAAAKRPGTQPCRSLQSTLLHPIWPTNKDLSPLGNYSLACRRVADQIWTSHLGGTDTSASCPFGNGVVFDGVDFDVDGGSNLYNDKLTVYLKGLYDQQTTKTYYLAAALQCVYPDYYLGTAIRKGLFDFVWVQFYNNPPCQYSTQSSISLL